ncbi:MAG: hypothetical protein HW387_785 [Parachlamydiales bacterium]|nr:hypothetical protein [Parachlamydiales bacterium]
MIQWKSFLIACLFLASCYRVSDKIEPRINDPIQELHFSRLHSPFAPLSEDEEMADWGREMRIALFFAKDLDLYRAVSTYKRAEILIGNKDPGRKTEIQYDILLCYYLGQHYDDAVDMVNKSALAHVDKTFPAYHDLLLILYECYHKMNCTEKEDCVFEMIQKDFPETAEKMNVSRALTSGNLDQIQQINQDLPHPSYLDPMLQSYEAEKKSVRTAQTLNALMPGAGYLYLGQKKSALTAFLLNGLFIAAAYEFFHHNYLAAGIITTSFEAGWYFGGIYGAGEEAKYYNERAYEKNAARTLNEHNLFPVLMMRYAF